MQIEPCLLCGEPAMERYALRRFEPTTLTEELLTAPLCEPHRSWLSAAGERGRTIGAVRWMLIATP
jgi:hypothetical protein